MKVLEAKFVQDFINLCEEGYRKGWHERNGGNLTYRIKPDEIQEISAELNYNSNFLDIGTTVKGLANEYFLVTGSGKFMMNVKRNPEENICIIQVDETGTKFRIVWGLISGGRPTSELPTHLMNMQVTKERTNGKFRVVYHCHATNIITLSFVLPLSEKVFTKELWKTATECAIVFPNGVGICPWMVPGGKDIAIKTSELIKKYDAVIWAHHGLFSVGEDFDSTFGLADTIEKSAEILVKIMSIKTEKLQTITDSQLLSLEKPFNVKLNREFIDEE